MKLINRLREIHLLLFIKMIPYMFYEYWMFSKQMVRCSMSKNRNKLLTEILMLTHAIEKAFSLHVKKKGFGMSKIILLEQYVEIYITKYGYNESMNVPISLIYKYLNYQKNVDYETDLLNNVQMRIDDLVLRERQNKADFHLAGFYEISKKELLKKNNFDFGEFAASRFSIRHFSAEEVSYNLVERAIEIAKKSPSACNRQSYRVHVYSGEMKDKILKNQGGANAFYHESDKAILIAADLNLYYSTEMHLGYVDGSLFAMSLIYAFHSLGVASIPLTMGRNLSCIRFMYKSNMLPQNEIPVLLIAIGHYPEEISVSMSYRNENNQFVTYH